MSITTKVKSVLGGIIPWQSARDVTTPLGSGNVVGVADGEAPIYKAVIPKFLYKPPYGYPRFVDIPELRRLAATPYVSMCISTIIDEIAAIPWDICPRETLDTPEGEESTDPVEHIQEVKEFFNNPNINKENFNTLLRRLLKDLLELDSAVLVKVFNQKGEFKEVYARDGGTFTMNPDPYGTFYLCDEIVPTWQLASKTKEEYEEYMQKKPAYFQYGWITGARPMPFGTREIIYMMRNPRTDNIYGRSPVEILLDTIQLLVYGQDANLDYFTDNNIPKGVFRMEGATSADIKAFKQQWQNATRVKNEVGDWRKRWWHMPVINMAGNFEKLQFSNAELQLISQQEWFTKLIWANFGVTPSELGYTESSNRATEIVQSKVFRRKAIRPILQVIEHHLNQELVWQEFHEDVEFKFILDDLAENLDKADLYEKYIKNGIKSINEIREEMGLPPVENGDKHRGTDTFNPFEQGEENNNPFQEQQEDDEEEDMDKKKESKSVNIESIIKSKLNEQEKVILQLLKQTLPGKSKIEQIKSVFGNEFSPETKPKYIRRWRGPDGRYRYQYRKPQGRRSKGISKDKAQKLYSLMFDDIGDGAGYKGKNEYQIGVRNMCEEAHCIFGSNMKELMYPEHANEKFHIGEELSLLKENVKEYQKNHPNYEVLNDEYTIKNAKRVTKVSKEIQERLNKLNPQTEKEIKNVKVAKLSNELIYRMSESIVKSPTEKPFEKVEHIINKIEEEYNKGWKSTKSFKALDNTLLKKIIGILSLDSVSDNVKKVVRDNYLKGHEKGEKAVNRNVQYNKEAVNFLEEYTFDNVKDISEEIKNDLRQELQRGIMNNEPYSKISERVKKVFNVHDSRAKAISVTEVTRAENAGMDNAIKTSGVKGKKEWVSVIDKKTSPICRRLNGQQVKVGEKFKDKEWEGEYPPSHVNCRSSIVFVPEE